MTRSCKRRPKPDADLHSEQDPKSAPTDSVLGKTSNMATHRHMSGQFREQPIPSPVSLLFLLTSIPNALICKSLCEPGASGLGLFAFDSSANSVSQTRNSNTGMLCGCLEATKRCDSTLNAPIKLFVSGLGQKFLVCPALAASLTFSGFMGRVLLAGRASVSPLAGAPACDAEHVGRLIVAHLQPLPRWEKASRATSTGKLQLPRGSPFELRCHDH